MKRRLAACIGLVMLAGSRGTAQAPQVQETPRFRSAVDLVPLDVTVVDSQGRPVLGLTTSDFTVVVDGTERRVVSAEWVSLDGLPAGPEVAVPDGYSSNQQATGGRLIVLAIDQPNIRFGGGRTIISAINRFIDDLSDSDRIALVGLGRGTASIPFTADRERIKQAIARINGQMQPPPKSQMFDITPSLTESFAITHGASELIERFIRSCTASGNSPAASAGVRSSDNGPQTCEQEIVREATDAVLGAETQRDTTIRALGDLLTSLKAIDAPKSLVLVSEGFAMFDEDDGTSSRLAALGSQAAAARTSIYALRLDDRFFDTSGGARPLSPRADAQLRSNGLETVTGAARGALFTVTNSGDAAFARIESELSGYYLLGIDLGPAPPKGKAPSLRVDVAQKGVTIRTRKTLNAATVDAARPEQSPLAAAAAALTTPLPLSALPLRVVSFNFQGPDPSKVQLLIHAEIGQEYRSAQSVAAAYMIVDSSGRVIDSEAFSQQMAPTGAGVLSPLAFSVTAAVPPGDYVLKIAAAEGGKVGSVEHPVHVALVDAGALKLSDLTVGGPFPSGGEPTRPTVDYNVRFGIVHGFLEAYGPRSATATVRYEIARDQQGAALMTEIVPARSVNESRALFSKRIAVSVLPPGKYFLRATVGVVGASPIELSRSFEIAAPATLTAAASASSSDIVRDNGTDLFLPIETEDIAVPFQAADALRPETLDPFIARVPAAARASFDAGIDALRKRDYVRAETSFKRAIVPNENFAAATAYLGVTFAASGHDPEAASAWQTAVIGGGNLPQIYLWLADALLRARDFGRARSALDDAARRWPDDIRFARPLAALNATTGRGREALEQLQRYLAANHDDLSALCLGVQWIYQARLNGVADRNPTEDLRLARMYADEYRRANGPKQVLVTQWLQYLENSGR